MDACGKTAGWIELLIGTVVGLFFVNAKLCRSGGGGNPTNRGNCRQIIDLKSRYNNCACVAVH